MSTRESAASSARVLPTTAVVPAAGFGTRLRPLTDTLPKEMLPVGGRLALEILLEELAAAGLSDAILVVSPPKESLIRGRFGERAGGLRIAYAVQPEMKGLGDAVWRAGALLPGDAAFVVALGDAVFEEPVPGQALGRLIEQTPAGAVGLLVQKVPRERLSRYGVVQPINGTAGPGFAIADLIEKPAPDEAPSDFAAAARYVVPRGVVEELARTAPDARGEVQLTDALRACLHRGPAGVAVPLRADEQRHDIGNLDSYFQAFTAFALADPERGPALRRFLEEKMDVIGKPSREVA